MRCSHLTICGAFTFSRCSLLRKSPSFSCVLEIIFPDAQNSMIHGLLSLEVCACTLRLALYAAEARIKRIASLLRIPTSLGPMTFFASVVSCRRVIIFTTLPSLSHRHIPHAAISSRRPCPTLPLSSSLRSLAQFFLISRHISSPPALFVV